MENTQFTQSDVYGNRENIEAVERIVEVKQPVVVELTSKKYKHWMLRGMGISFVGFMIAIVGTIGSFSVKQGALGLIILCWFLAFIIFGIGIVITTIARLLAWWNNG